MGGFGGTYGLGILPDHERDLTFGSADWGRAIDPKGLRWYLEQVDDRYQIPLIVVEKTAWAR